MPEQNDETIVPLEIVQGFFEMILRGLVEHGDVQIGDRSIEQIFEQYNRMVAEIHNDGDFEWHLATDHRLTLLDKARVEVQAGNRELAVTLYAIWIEHFINAMLLRAFERMGYGATVSTPIIKELRLHTKASALWSIAKLPAISEESLHLLNRIVESRNGFVHYKWAAVEVDTINQQDDRLSTAIAGAEELVSSLLAVESSAVWNGRDKEVIGHLHDDILRHYGEEAFRLSFSISHTEASKVGHATLRSGRPGDSLC